MWESHFAAAKILIIDDNEDNLTALRIILQRNGFHDVVLIPDSRYAINVYQHMHPSLILLDMRMPHLDGFQILAQLRHVAGPDAYLPVIVLTADLTMDTKRRALAMGAQDFLTKPLDPIEVILRMRNVLQISFSHQYMLNQNHILAHLVTQRTYALEHAHTELLLRLARAAEYRDDQTGQHAQRVGGLAQTIGGVLGLSAVEAAVIGQAAALHDIGKIGIPDRILLKTGPLDAEERRAMQRHTSIGGAILEGSAVPVLQLGEIIAVTHHEWWDGRGYPQQLRGTAIPLVGQIVAVADAFDVMTHPRPYKDAQSRDSAATEIQRQSGTQFSPRVVAAFLTWYAQREEDSAG